MAYEPKYQVKLTVKQVRRLIDIIDSSCDISLNESDNDAFDKLITELDLAQGEIYDGSARVSELVIVIT
jgi:hypothetical protein